MAKKSPNPTDKHIGRRVRMRRMMLGLSQEKLGDAIGLTFQQVQKYEKGVNRIGGSRMQQMAEALQVPPSFFFEGLPAAGAEADGESPAAQLTTSFFSIPHAAELAEAFVKLTTEQRRVVIDVAIALDHAHLSGTVKQKAA